MQNTKLTDAETFHITARTNNQFYFPNLPEVWEIYSEQLHFLRFSFEVQIHAFVLMGNHFHLMGTFKKDERPLAMNYFMRETSRQIGHMMGTKNHVYGRRHFRTRLCGQIQFLNCYKYVLRNPVEANICDHVEQYSYSSFSRMLGFDHLLIPIEEDRVHFENPLQNLNWLNHAPSREDREFMKASLRRSWIRKSDPITRKPHRLNTELY